mmetsp:Transcript_987/g.2117  ORF Transcript_987/g.2117 Transcript_987/m.2117 type:complete len:288 (-) Transcript_987:4-867(-)
MAASIFCRSLARSLAFRSASMLRSCCGRKCRACTSASVTTSTGAPYVWARQLAKPLDLGTVGSRPACRLRFRTIDGKGINGSNFGSGRPLNLFLREPEAFPPFCGAGKPLDLEDEEPLEAGPPPFFRRDPAGGAGGRAGPADRGWPGGWPGGWAAAVVAWVAAVGFHTWGLKCCCTSGANPSKVRTSNIRIRSSLCASVSTFSSLASVPPAAASLGAKKSSASRYRAAPSPPRGTSLQPRKLAWSASPSKNKSMAVSMFCLSMPPAVADGPSPWRPHALPGSSRHSS